MVMALGDTYEKLERLQEAKKCYWKAHSIGDIEGQALVKLAKYVRFICSEHRKITQELWEKRTETNCLNGIKD